MLLLVLCIIFSHSYPYAGHVSVNISRLHASLAHFDVSKDEFQARIIHVNSYADVAHMIRSIGELAHKSDKVDRHVRCCKDPITTGLGYQWMD